MIITSGGVLDDNGVLTGNWTDRISIKSIFDGTSNTFLAGEMHIPLGQINVTPFNGPMFNGAELVAHSRIGGPGIPILKDSEEPGLVFGFGSVHPSGCNFVSADGSTRTQSATTDTVLLAKLCHREDGSVINND